MKNKIKAVFTILFIPAIILLASCQKQKEEWKVTIEEENGVKVIINPEEPRYGETELELEMDLSIGGENAGENYNFSYVRDIDVDGEGNIYVVDSGQYRIQKYDKNGNYLKTIGRRGQGPGEFQTPFGMSFDAEGRIYVREYEKIQILDRDGNYLRGIKVDHRISSDILSNEGNLVYCTGPIYSQKASSLNVILIDYDKEEVNTIASFQDPTVVLRKSPSEGRRGAIMGFPPPYSPGLFFCPLSEELAIYGYSSKYKLSAVNSSGEIVYIIEKEEIPQLASKKEELGYLEKRIQIHEEGWEKKGGFPFSRGELKEIYDFPKYKPFFTSIITDDEGRMFLQKPKSVLHEEIDSYFDLFNKEGYYLYKIKIHAISPDIIKKGFAYTFQANPDTGYYKIERFRIKNWDQIKTGFNYL